MGERLPREANIHTNRALDAAEVFRGPGEVLDKSGYLGEDRVHIPAGHGKR